MPSSVFLMHTGQSILRLGDVSLIDVNSFRVAGIGELKTTPIKPGELSITLLVMGQKENLSFESITKSPPSTKSPLRAFPPAMKTRLNRQIARNAKALSSNSINKDGSQINIRLETYIPDFERMLKAARIGHFSYQQFGPGLLCTVFKHNKKTLSSVLVCDKEINVSKKLDDLTEHAMNLILPESPHNSIDIGSLIYSRNGATKFQLGTLPVFWWPLDV